MKILIFSGLFFAITLSAQEFRPYHETTDSSMTKKMVGKKTIYSYDTYFIEIMGKQFKVKQNKKLIFTDELKEGTKMVLPSLFISENQDDPTIICAQLTSNAVYGFNLYMLNGENTKLVSFISVAMPGTTKKSEEVGDKYESISTYLKLETNGSQWRISFNADRLVIHPGADREEIVDGSTIKFLYNGKKLKEVLEF